MQIITASVMLYVGMPQGKSPSSTYKAAQNSVVTASNTLNINDSFYTGDSYVHIYMKKHVYSILAQRKRKNLPHPSTQNTDNNIPKRTKTQTITYKQKERGRTLGAVVFIGTKLKMSVTSEKFFSVK